MSIAPPAPPFTPLELPPPQVRFTCSFEETLRLRRSIRAYRRAPVSLGAAAQLLWSAQGITDGADHRAAPSAGGIYPLVAVLIAGDVDGLDAGVFRYRPGRHRIDRVREGDVRGLLARACLDQAFIGDASLSILLAADARAMEDKFGDAARAYVDIEAGCALQNMALQAVALDLGSVIIGAFHEPLLSELLGLAPHEWPASMLTIGHPAS